MTQPDNKELRDSEIKQAFELLERKRLKQLFNELEKMQLRAEATISPMFIWRKFAVAASVFGLIITSGVTDLNNRENNLLALERDLIKENVNNLNNTVLNRSMAYQKPVINEIRNRNNISISVKTLDDLSEISEENSLGYRKVIAIDSVNAYYAKYIFTENKLTIYLNENRKIKIVEFQNMFFIKIDGTIFEIKKTNKLSSLSIVRDKKVIKIINRLFK